ncbi:hypothetical protein HO173_013286 [Letharia columbiana]|uniref:Uncharacterized protein n=1 Tax=Letharia columbiana TaxID=112416 RepID=A0A8H6CGI9_9LECA|nr:uncharacterized protein HO173_013286 [Letharia columbiana]KAF6223124.1 hypothetical protein HO173_013286 [Letharia columbiana]
MFSRSAFFTGRTPPVPEAFPKSATARGKQKDKNELEQNQSAPHSPSPETSRASRSSSPIQPQLRDSINKSSSSFIGKNASPDHLDVLAEAATSSRAKGAETEARARELIEKEGLNQAERISSMAAEKRHFVEMVQKQAVEEATDPNHKSLCKKVGEMVGQDLAEVTIYPMLDIEHSDKAMIARVKNLLGPSISGDDVVLGKPFVAEQEDSMAILDDESLCGILVTTQSLRGAVRVADLANLKKQREKGFVGYGEVKTHPKELWDFLVMIVKRGQNAVVEGSPTLRLFMRVAQGTAEDVAMLAAEDAWLFRTPAHVGMPSAVWHNYDFTKK